MLTHRQKELLLLIHRHTLDGGIPPSFDEMKDAVGLKSKSGVHRLITGLEERGFIRRLPNKARALEVLRLPDDSVARGETPARITNEAILAKVSPPTNDNVSIPVLGRIAAGNPIEAISNPSHFIDLPPSMLSPSKHYALEVDGDSMVDAGIMDGDTVIIEQTDRVRNGEIAVCLVEREEVTLKYYREDASGRVTLIPANEKYQPRQYNRAQVDVQGRLSTLLRQY